MPNNDQLRFLDDEFFTLTLMATTQRTKLYMATAKDPERDSARKALRAALSTLTPAYGRQVSDSEHGANIEGLAKGLTAEHASALRGGHFRIGLAQKALNLHLKYMWCLNRVVMPPHCPLDAFVLDHIPGCSDVKWTQMDSLPEYQELISRARKVAGDEPLAVWELRLWSLTKRNSASPRT